MRFSSSTQALEYARLARHFKRLGRRAKAQGYVDQYEQSRIMAAQALLKARQLWEGAV